jgi:hypothetical protein
LETALLFLLASETALLSQRSEARRSNARPKSKEQQTQTQQRKPATSSEARRSNAQCYSLFSKTIRRKTQ